uniref:Myelin transcription factor 1 like n=1 Tax=Homo sapiens TaxID=9606 RepID=A0A3B3IRQ0_HUMAN
MSCPTPGCDGSGHVSGSFLTHRRCMREVQREQLQATSHQGAVEFGGSCEGGRSQPAGEDRARRHTPQFP